MTPIRHLVALLRATGRHADLYTVLSTRSESLLRWAAAHERGLWIAVVLTGAADVVLTAYGLQLGLREMNPVVRQALAVTGVPALAVLKAGALAVGVCCTWLVPDRYTAIVPLGLVGPSTVAVVINTTLVVMVHLGRAT